MDFSTQDIIEALETLGALLEDRGQQFELVAIGGSCLMLLGFIERPTKDLDVVALVENNQYVSAQPLPKSLSSAVRDVADTMGLAEDWLNPGPTDLLDLGLPSGFQDRVEKRKYGSLILHIAGRFDQICFKLYAVVDQGPRSKHFADIQKLKPTEEELLTAARWTKTHDPSEGFYQALLEALSALGVVANDRI